MPRLLLLSSTLVIAACTPATPSSAPSAKRNTRVHISLPSNDGARVTLPVARTHATVADFWAPTCIPCRQSLPALVEKRGAIEAKGGVLVLVAVLGESESTEVAEASLASWGVKSSFVIDRVLSGGVGAAQEELGVRSLPATLVLDGAGIIRWVAPDGASADDVVRAIP